MKKLLLACAMSAVMSGGLMAADGKLTYLENGDVLTWSASAPSGWISSAVSQFWPTVTMDTTTPLDSLPNRSVTFFGALGRTDPEYIVHGACPTTTADAIGQRGIVWPVYRDRSGTMRNYLATEVTIVSAAAVGSNAGLLHYKVMVANPDGSCDSTSYTSTTWTSAAPTGNSGISATQPITIKAPRIMFVRIISTTGGAPFRVIFK